MGYEKWVRKNRSKCSSTVAESFTCLTCQSGSDGAAASRRSAAVESDGHHSRSRGRMSSQDRMSLAGK